jgi:rRNA maturation RNase YbeY
MLRLHCSPDLAEAPQAACLERLTQVAHRTLSCHNAGGLVDVILTSDDEVCRLNSMYRGRNQATDVLSFSFVENGPQAIVAEECCVAEDIPAGEVYISVERATAQADDLNVSHEEELARLLVHGLLHLAGYDHQTEAELCVMEQLTESLLFADPAQPGATHKPDPSWPTDSPKGV